MEKKVLVVDDEPDLLKIAVFRLKKAGYKILTAINGQQALDAIRNDPPALVLLDLLLPVMDGVQVCQRIREDKSLPYIPVILFTASTLGIEEKVKEAQADDYLIKPFEIDELLKKVEGLLDSAKA